MQLTLHTLKSISKPSIAVIGLHGWTGDEYAMESVAKLLKLKHVKWFFPRAPYKAPSSKGFTWFEGSDDKGWNYEKTYEGLDRLLEQISNEGFSKEKLFVIGFSQGACLAMEYVLRLPFSIAGIIPVAGFIKFKENLKAEHSMKSKSTRVLLMHGTKDEIIDLKESQDSYQILKKLGYSVELQTYDAGHKISLSSKSAIESFIK